MISLQRSNKSVIIDNILKEARIDKKAVEFNSEEALKKYLQQHPNADKTKHKVKQKKEKTLTKDDTKNLKNKIEQKKKTLTEPKKSHPFAESDTQTFDNHKDLAEHVTMNMKDDPKSANHLKKEFKSNFPNGAHFVEGEAANDIDQFQDAENELGVDNWESVNIGSDPDVNDVGYEKGKTKDGKNVMKVSIPGGMNSYIIEK